MTQASQLALSGFIAFGVGWGFLAVGVLFMATLTLGTITSVLIHRIRRSSAVHQAPRQDICG
ncbi:hypothetical protein LTH96_08395 [Nesterenkonia sp. LB17]|nr:MULTISPECIES: hypothetical protein [unclassified Nesterenkonia]MCH8560419.1 hypothetical protein [Nesterenkonia sp. DZ6]MCH8562685.1 hypothetical protein [Nesterenkonia sp. YGD6]MCH8565735.1 hypothetical protein [Nesterenkonia sp. LB17]MCH8570527.1 hypothetical protein [Nesterenkonia sp. AY15]